MPKLGDLKTSSRTTAADCTSIAGGCGRRKRDELFLIVFLGGMTGTHCEGDEDLTTLVEGNSGRDGDESEVEEATEGERGRFRVSIQASLVYRAVALRIVVTGRGNESKSSQTFPKATRNTCLFLPLGRIEAVTR